MEGVTQMKIEREDGYIGDFGKEFDSEECLEIARELSSEGRVMREASTGVLYGTPKGLVSIIDLSHELHRDYGRMAKVLLANGWTEHPQHRGYYLPPPETKPSSSEVHSSEDDAK